MNYELSILKDDGGLELGWIRKFEFRLGNTYLTLEVPPFYVNFIIS